MLTAGGAILGEKGVQCPTECPTTDAGTVSISTTGLSEGAHTLTIRATDRAGNTADSSFRVFVDRTAPPPPTEIQVEAFDPLTGLGRVAWMPGDDPDLPDGEVPAENDVAEFRYQRGGTWTSWTTSEDDGFDVQNMVPGEPITVEVRSIDSAGNRGQPSSALLLMAAPPDALAPLQPSGGTNTLEVDATFSLSDGSTVPRAGMLVVLKDDLGRLYPAETNEAGRATYGNLPDGVYELLLGYGPERTDRVEMRSGSRRQYATQSQYDDLTPEERDFCRTWPVHCAYFRDDRTKAQKFAERLFTQPEPGSDGTKTNAFKHSYWVALMVNSIVHSAALDDDKKFLADEFADAHEADARRGNLTNQRESSVDSHNNGVGYRWARDTSPDSRGRKHNDTFYCNTLRKRIRRARRVRFRKASPAFTTRTIPRVNQLAYRRSKHRDTGGRDRLREKSEFPNNEPCEA